MPSRRRCRHCGRVYQPQRRYHYWCSWTCRVADVGAHHRRVASAAVLQIPRGIWKGMLLLCHPDKYEHEPGLRAVAGEVTRWLLEHRPPDSS